MKVGSLRDCNILIHLNMSQARERVPDLPAVYLIEPTAENFKRVAQDAAKNIYDYVMISFTKPLSQAQMENFASELVKVNQSHKVLRVTQEYLGGYQVISPDFFVLPGGENNFSTLSYTKDDAGGGRVVISKAVDHIANGLFCFFQSLGVAPPVIRLTESD